MLLTWALIFAVVALIAVYLDLAALRPPLRAWREFSSSFFWWCFWLPSSPPFSRS